MIVDTRAYVIYLISVLIACIIRDFLIPLFVWKNYLRARSYAYRFWFCIISQAFIQINLVIALGIFNILNRYTFIIFNILIYILIKWNYSNKLIFYNLKIIFADLWTSYKDGRFLRHISSSFANALKSKYRDIRKWSIWTYLINNWFKTILILGIFIYNIWFFTYTLMSYHSYQFSDIPVHQSWIYELEQGNLYVDGIYPYGMHIMIYFIRAFFNINLREILLYHGTYQFLILLIGIYLLAKEVFKGKYTPLAVIVITSFMVNQGRYAASLPQEAGMFLVIAITYFMIRFLHKEKSKFVISTDSKIRSFFRIRTYINRIYIDSEMILLMLSISLVISYHYYTAIAAIIIILSIGLVYIFRILKKKYFLPLIFCGIMGLLIVIIPTGIFLAKGVPFQESIDWAMTVMSGEEWRGSDLDYQDNLLDALKDTSEDSLYNDLKIEEDSDNIEAVDYSTMSIKEIARYYYNAILDFGIGVMFGYEATKLLFICMIIGFFSGIFMLFYKKTRKSSYDYLTLVIIVLLFYTLGSSQSLGLPEIIAAARASTFIHPFFAFIYMLPVDLVFRILSSYKGRYYQVFSNGISLATCFISLVLIINSGLYHNYFEINQAYYNEPEYLIRNIAKDFDKYSYTIVSTTDERFEVINHGRHTELSKFVNMVDGNEESFNFTTEYVFFFIEKVLLQDYNYGRVEVDYKYAAMDFIFLGDVQDYYFQRAIIESKAYYWAKSFKKIYPNSFKTYYEDDIYIVYLMQQNTYYPYEIQIDYLSKGEGN